MSLCFSIVGMSARIWFVMSAQEDVGPKETGMGVVDLGRGVVSVQLHSTMPVSATVGQG